MKNFLYGTTALIAVGLVAGGAAAQQAAPAKAAAEPLKLSITGNWQMFAGFGKQSEAFNSSFGGAGSASQTGAGKRNHGIQREGEIHFTGQTTLANGTKVGLKVELEAQGVADNSSSFDGTAQSRNTANQAAPTTGRNSSQIDESVGWFDASWGRLEFGATWGPGLKMQYGGYNPIPNFGNLQNNGFVQYPSAAPESATTPVNTYNVISGKNDKVALYTPRVYGLQFGMSYTPEGGTDGRQGGESGSTYGFQYRDTTGQQSQIMEYGLNYVNKFGGVDLALFASLATAKLERGISTGTSTDTLLSNDDRQSWALGANVKMFGVEAGGSFKHDNRGLKNPTRDRDQWEVGVGYTMGPARFGVQYLESKADDLNVTTAASTNHTKHTDKLSMWQIGGTYNLGPGIDLIGGVQLVDVSNGCKTSGTGTTGAGGCALATATASSQNVIDVTNQKATTVVFGTRLRF
jgi:hypothetical protein